MFAVGLSNENLKPNITNTTLKKYNTIIIFFNNFFKLSEPSEYTGLYTSVMMKNVTEFDQSPFKFFFFSEGTSLLQTLSFPFPDVHVNVPQEYVNHYKRCVRFHWDIL